METCAEIFAYALPLVLGYGVALGLGQLFIQTITGPLWKKIGLPNDSRYGHSQSAVLGLVEGTLYISALIVGQAQMIAIWLGLKTVIKWRHWESDVAIPGKDGEKPRWVLGRMAYNLFLLSNALVVLYSAAGWKVYMHASEGRWAPVAAVIAGLILWSLAITYFSRETRAYVPLDDDDPRLSKNQKSSNEIKR